MINKSRGKTDKGLWYLNNASSVCVHSPTCAPVINPGLGAASLSKLPVVRDYIASDHDCNLRLLAQKIMDSHGFQASISTLCRAVNTVKGVLHNEADSDLQSLGKLLQSFFEKNGGDIILEKDDDDVLHRVFLCPGDHQKAVLACLDISENDAFHIKNQYFNFQIAATALMTNQRNTFIYAAAIFPIENKDNWNWYMSKLNKGPLAIMLHSSKALLVGDSEKGEEDAADTIFPESQKADCRLHIKKRMEKHHIRPKPENSHIWWKVATSLTLQERDEWWEMLERTEPRQAAFLKDIPKIKWQVAEQLAAGIMTHSTVTNNLAEGIGHTLCRKELGDLPIRYRSPAGVVRGLLELFSERSIRIHNLVKKLEADQVMYSDYALSDLAEQEVEALSYSAVMVGRLEWAVRRVGIITDRVRHVKWTGLPGPYCLFCECLHTEDCGRLCRHKIATCKAMVHDPRFQAILERPFTDQWLNSKYVEAFKDFQVTMPSETEIYNCSGNMFPGPLHPPNIIPQHGRPKKLRHKTAGEQFKRKMRVMTGTGEDDKHRQCSLCKAVGHRCPNCPMYKRFKLQAPGGSKKAS